ncbi:MAG: tRNA uridine-5-carboxymethylaminomethyl(34) synthesis GTPase MnmE [Xanthomonadales bacterium]|nr:tRNA uridine-5-carboxymethylaminomethyl(34) synthesis GTPase MnmE [Xanthomonadales bacterium]
MTLINPSDTIVAPATAPGRGGIGVVRLSGPGVPVIASALLGGRLPEPRRATLATFRDGAGEAIDSGLALYFPAPHSYTGEAVLELHGHGGPAVLASLVARAIELGARRAEPGEFTRRAYLNDKLDLAQAEAVADLIDAGSQAAARAALRSLQGAFSAEVHGLVEGLIELRVWVEAAIDFPEEDIDFLADPALVARVEALRARFDAVTQAARQGRVLRDGLTVVIAGRPNAGKSSLLNALAGHEAAIVTDLPGTTRDVVREQLDLDGLPLQVLDTAGLRVAGEGPADVVEAEGIRRTRAEIARADRVLFVVDAATDPAATAYTDERATLPEGVPVTLVFNKVDLPTALEVVVPGVDAQLRLSARTGEGLAALRAHLQAAIGYSPTDTGAVSARARHLEALTRARATLEAACTLLAQRRGELVAEELRLAQRALGEITGEFTSDDLLGRIFGSFCIGK